MAACPILIYCAGNNRRFDDIALAAGYRLGSLLPGTIYHPVYFADQDWKRPNRSAYMAALAEHRPHMATVLDWEFPAQLDEVLDWAQEVALYVQQVLIVPKVIGGIGQIPRYVGQADVVLAYSVPTQYGGSQLPLWEFAGWPVHLLGGSPHKQMQIYAHLTPICDVVSVDGNMTNKMAQSCMFWDMARGPKGHWRSLKETGNGDWGKDANYEAFRRSCVNVMAAWRRLNA